MEIESYKYYKVKIETSFYNLSRVQYFEEITIVKGDELILSILNLLKNKCYTIKKECGIIIIKLFDTTNKFKNAELKSIYEIEILKEYNNIEEKLLEEYSLFEEMLPPIECKGLDD